jgi:hypothetical protein
MTQTHKHTNRLIHESSLYLLQHAHNPVNWHAWNEDSLKKAREENKLLLISIGYSSCHWCHVMERESFEDIEVAAIMNENFINIKVDREERPDIDQVYMHAVQLLSGHGGWPLNCIALPDGRTLYGGTYFPKQQWKNILIQVAELFKNDKEKCNEYAGELMRGMAKTESYFIKKPAELLTREIADEMFARWSQGFDKSEGGMDRAPKFPMPNNYEFLLRYHYHSRNTAALHQVLLTLDKMAYGGIYDQIGGGFARYSTDALWKVPHFEKMLYDNAQLVSLYSHAYQITQKPLYRQIVYETLGFIEREMTSSEGLFCTALDADSEGEEGKFYVWKEPELKNILGRDADIFFDYFSVNQYGYWEGNYILLRMKSDEEVSEKHQVSIDALRVKISEWKRILLEQRNKRTRPGLDDKQLLSWNALMITGYADAFKVFGEEKFLMTAKRAADFILANMKHKEGSLFHSYKNGKATINAFLDDYAFLIHALISTYEVTGIESYIREAKSFAEYILKNFYDDKTGFFFYTGPDDRLILRKKEIDDNVIPSSNSAMAHALFRLGKLFTEREYIEHARQMVINIKEEMVRYAGGYSNWGLLLLNFAYPYFEVAFSGRNAFASVNELNKKYLPNKIIAASAEKSFLPLLENRYNENQTLIYVCNDFTCRLPVNKTEEAIQLIKNS